MKTFYPADPIAEDHTLETRIPVADLRLILKLVDAGAVAFGDKFADKLERMRSYLADRDAGEHCFVSMGNAHKECHPNGYWIATEPVKAAKLEYGPGGMIDDHGRAVAHTSPCPDGDFANYRGDFSNVWYVYFVEYGADGLNPNQYRTAKEPFGRYEGGPGAAGGRNFLVHNPGLPDVYREDVTSAALTCYLRGKGLAEKKAAEAAAKTPKPKRGKT